MSMYGAGESFEILIDDENLDELIAVRTDDRDVPGRRDNENCQRVSRIPLFPFVPTSLQEQIEEKRQSRKQNRHRAFCKHAEADERIEREKPPSTTRIARVAPHQEREEGDCQAGREYHIHRSRPREGEIACTGRKDQARPYGRRPAPKAAAHKIHQEQRYRCRHRGWQSRRELPDTENPKADRGEPVHQNGFLEPWHAMKTGGDVVPRLVHSTRNGSVTRLIRTKQADARKTVKEEKVGCRCQKKQRQRLLESLDFGAVYG